MLNRKFKEKENRMLLVCICLMLAAFYYLLAAKPVQAQISQNQQTQAVLEDELAIEVYKAEKKTQMLKRMGQESEKSRGTLCPYNNLKAEMQELEQILAASDTYEIQISPATFSDSIVQRDVFVSFQTDTYDRACEIVSAVERGSFRCMIKEVYLSAETGEEGQKVSMKFLVTYYEKAEDGFEDME